DLHAHVLPRGEKAHLDGKAEPIGPVIRHLEILAARDAGSEALGVEEEGPDRFWRGVHDETLLEVRHLPLTLPSPPGGEGVERRNGSSGQRGCARRGEGTGSPERPRHGRRHSSRRRAWASWPARRSLSRRTARGPGLTRVAW